MSESTESVLFHSNNNIAYITINRPKALNALNAEVIELFHQIIDQKIDLEKTRALVVQSCGEKAFVAGADIKQMSQLSPDQAKAFAQKGQSLSRKLENLPFPVIAKVQGFALGGGCELAMSCDIIIAAKTAKFGQPEVGLGLIAGFGGTQRLARRVGYVCAMDILCSGQLISGERAHTLGLVSRCVDAGELDQTLNKVLKGILKGEPKAIAQSKKLAALYLSEKIDGYLDQEAIEFKKCFERDQSKEGMKAFIERKPASFCQEI